jgi:serine protein kinase
MNRTIRVYPAFSEFYGAAQGLEEHKQIMYLLAPMLEDRYGIPQRRLTALPTIAGRPALSEP